ncbi:MAG: glucose-1-phosphate thymidylyltransferase [Thermodesulfobacteriota bacterium]
MEELAPRSFFHLEQLDYADLFDNLPFAWEALDRLETYIRGRIKPNAAGLTKGGPLMQKTLVLWRDEILAEGFDLKPGDATKGRFEVLVGGRRLDGASVIYAGACLMDGEIEIGPGTVVEPGALIRGPSIIGPRTEVRQGAYLRGSCLIGRGCVAGHATEIKNSVMLDGAKAGHFAYLGDSILGREVNLGAGTKLANLKMMPLPFRVKLKGQTIMINRKKLGAILGDRVETGCNSVTNPGTFLAPGCLVSPNTTVPAGYHPAGTFVRIGPGPGPHG